MVTLITAVIGGAVSGIVVLYFDAWKRAQAGDYDE